MVIGALRKYLIRGETWTQPYHHQKKHKTDDSASQLQRDPGQTEGLEVLGALPFVRDLGAGAWRIFFS